MKFFALSLFIFLSAVNLRAAEKTGTRNLLRPGQISFWASFKSGEEHFDSKIVTKLLNVSKKYCSEDMRKFVGAKVGVQYSVAVLTPPKTTIPYEFIDPATGKLVGWLKEVAHLQLYFRPYLTVVDPDGISRLVVADWPTVVTCDDFAR